MDIQNDFEKLDIPLLSLLSVIYQSAHKMIFTLQKFERYTLGEKIEKNILEAIELTVIASTANKFDKEKMLSRLNAKIEILKILYRLALNADMIKPEKYLALEKQLQEAGRQTQGWINYTRNLK